MRMAFTPETNTDPTKPSKGGTFRITGETLQLLMLNAELVNSGFNSFIAPTEKGLVLMVVALDASAVRDMRRMYRHWRSTQLTV